MKTVSGALAVLIALSVVAGPSAADERGYRRGGEHRWHQGGRGDIHRFHEHDFGSWRRGHWHHGRHAGRAGWWWIVGGIWYFYPAPVYPYPDPYLPPGVVVPSAPTPGGAQYWYYCDNPPGYYPYVARCVSPWRPVPATVPPGALR